MPQMNPMNWFVLWLFYIISFLLMYVKLSYFYNKSISLTLSKTINSFSFNQSI